MMQDFISSIDRKYIRSFRLAIVFIVAVAGILFFFSHHYYKIIIKSNLPYTIYARDNTGHEKRVVSIFGVFLIPRSADTIVAKTDTINLSYQESRSPIRRSVLPQFTTRYISLKPQYDVVNDGPSSGCVYGKYPHLYTYSCSNPTSITQLNSSNPTEYPIIATLPPTIIAATSQSTAASERLFTIQPYGNKLLSVVSTTISDNGVLGDYMIRLYEGDHFSQYPIGFSLEGTDTSSLALATTRDGSENFLIIDQSNSVVYAYSSLGATPTKIQLHKPFRKGLSISCSVRRKVIACYSGLASDYIDSEGGDEVYKNATDGSIEIFDSTGRKISAANLKKQDAIESICVDSDNVVYGFSASRLYKLDNHSDTYTPVFLDSSIESYSCGDGIYYTSDHGTYHLLKNESQLIYANKSLPLYSIVSLGDDSLHATGRFEKRDGAPQQLTLLKREDGNNNYRTADLASHTVNNISDVYFDLDFNQSSIRYITIGDEAQKKALESRILSSQPKNTGVDQKFFTLEDFAPPVIK